MSKQEQSSQQQLNESLSALMDGEASELELRRVLKSSDESLDARWARYHLASDAMRGEVELPESMDLSASISAAIAEEPTYSAAAKKADKEKSSFWPNLGRFAVAASVAGAVVIGVQFAPNKVGNDIAGTATPASTPASSPIQSELGNNTSVRVVGNQAASEPRQKPIVINEATREQLKQMEGEMSRLMREHAQNASQNTQQGVLPYVRVPDAEQ